MGFREAEAQPNCVGTVGLSPIIWGERPDPSPVPSFPRAWQGEWMWVSIQTQNLTPSNTMMTIWGQQEGHLQDSNSNRPSVLKQQIWMDFSVLSGKCHSAFCCCLLSSQRSCWASFHSLIACWLLTQMDYFITVWQLLIYPHTNSKGLFPPSFT